MNRIFLTVRKTLIFHCYSLIKTTIFGLRIIPVKFDIFLTYIYFLNCHILSLTIFMSNLNGHSLDFNFQYLKNVSHCPRPNETNTGKTYIY